MSAVERWRASLALAARLGITPESFWRLSIVEWSGLVPRPPQALTRAGLEALMQDHPDRRENNG